MEAASSKLSWASRSFRQCADRENHDAEIPPAFNEERPEFHCSDLISAKLGPRAKLTVVIQEKRAEVVNAGIRLANRERALIPVAQEL